MKFLLNYNNIWLRSFFVSIIISTSAFAPTRGEMFEVPKRTYSLNNNSPEESQVYTDLEEKIQWLEYLTVYNFRSKSGAKNTLIHPALIYGLARIDSVYPGRLIVNSGYRTRSHNVRVAGARRSTHINGMAADIKILGVSNLHLALLAIEFGFGGVGLYPTHIHVDVGPVRSWQKQIKRA